MKICKLKENEPLELIEVSLNMQSTSPECKNSKEIALTEIQMKVFTDGVIEKESEGTVKNIDKYYIGKKEYKYKVNTLKTKNVFFKDYSYVITYLIAEEWLNIEGIHGLFDVIKDISIYLKNPKDKKTLKIAKQVIKEIANHNDSINYSSLLGMFVAQGKRT